jgi:predicted PurR-regulated permease PerM
MSMPTSEPPPERSPFLGQLQVATFSVLMLVLVVHLLDQFRALFQPLFIGVLIAYVILPIHAWLVRRGIPSIVAYGAILFLLLLLMVGIGTLAFVNGRELTTRLPEYEERLEKALRDAIAQLPIEPLAEGRLRQLLMTRYVTVDNVMGTLGAAASTFLDFVTWLSVTFLYLLFLIIERETFPQRIRRAFSEGQAERVLGVIGSINEAIARYISIKTFVSLLAGVASLLVLWAFGVEFAVTWALLIFLFNYIPYIGSLIATLLPIAWSLVQLGVWQCLAVTVLLIAIQQIIGTFVEPRITGQRLGVSPLLILLSLAFWGVVWGIVGMILAVPMLVVLKIVLDNIRETRPLATLMSNM